MSNGISRLCERSRPRTCLRFRSATLIVNSLSRLMHQHPLRPTLLLFAGAMLASLAIPLAQRQAAIRRVPTFHVDPLWPKQLPNKWIVGAVAGVAVDKRDHVWITHRPSTLQPNETRSIWKAAPPVLEFDAVGCLLSAWGSPGTGYDWPQL